MATPTDGAVFTAKSERIQVELSPDWSRDLYSAIGEMLVASGQLEYLITVAYKRASGRTFEDIARDKFDPGQWKTRLLAVHAKITEMKPRPRLSKRAHEVCSGQSATVQALNERHEIAHSALVLSLPHREPLRILPRPHPALGFVAEHVDVEILREKIVNITARLREATREIEALTREVFFPDGSHLRVATYPTASAVVSQAPGAGPGFATMTLAAASVAILTADDAQSLRRSEAVDGLPPKLPPDC